MSHEYYIINSKPDKLYVNPAKDNKGAYAQLIDESESLIGEIEIGTRFKLSISMFYANDKQDFTTFRLTKLKFHKTHGWQNDGEVSINGFQLNKLTKFISIISSLNLSDAKKTRISLDALNIDALNAVLGTDRGAEFLKKIADSPELTDDIFALAHKKVELEIFRKLLEEFENYKDEYTSTYNLTNKTEEGIWQNFFERNPWIFGHGLNYIFLGSEGNKLEKTTTGYSYDNKAGNRVDALMHTKAIISQHVLIEIKKPSSDLLEKTEYRSGCWSASKELSGAVSQIQKTAYDFTANTASKTQVKDSEGILLLKHNRAVAL